VIFVGCRPGPVGVARWARATPIVVARATLHHAVLRPLLCMVLRVRVELSSELSAIRSPVVLVANHASHLDAPLILCTLPRGLRRIAVGAAADYFFASPLRALATAFLVNGFPVGRQPGHSRPGLVGRLVDEGWHLLLFPEGTRSRDGSHGRFHLGAAALCVSKGLWCVPVGIGGTHRAMPKGARWPRSGRPIVTIHYGAPLRPAADEDARTFTYRIRAAVLSTIDQRGNVTR